MSATSTTPTLMTRLLAEVLQDLGVLYGMGVNNPHEPEPAEAREYVDEVSQLWHLRNLITKAGIDACPVSFIPTDVDTVSTLVGAFYARVRSPTWLPHPVAASNTSQAQKLAVGRVLAAATQTLTQTLVASGYQGNFEGSPQEVRDDVRTFLESESR
jgi:hypothetical protein